MLYTSFLFNNNEIIYHCIGKCHNLHSVIFYCKCETHVKCCLNVYAILLDKYSNSSAKINIPFPYDISARPFKTLNCSECTISRLIIFL